jgi:hypothetical protein
VLCLCPDFRLSLDEMPVGAGCLEASPRVLLGRLLAQLKRKARGTIAQLAHAHPER